MGHCPGKGSWGGHALLGFGAAGTGGERGILTGRRSRGQRGGMWLVSEKPPLTVTQPCTRPAPGRPQADMAPGDPGGPPKAPPILCLPHPHRRGSRRSGTCQTCGRCALVQETQQASGKERLSVLPCFQEITRGLSTSERCCFCPQPSRPPLNSKVPEGSSRDLCPPGPPQGSFAPGSANRVVSKGRWRGGPSDTAAPGPPPPLAPTRGNWSHFCAFTVGRGWNPGPT